MGEQVRVPVAVPVDDNVGAISAIANLFKTFGPVE
jgi:hypothetical protein